MRGKRSQTMPRRATAWALMVLLAGSAAGCMTTGSRRADGDDLQDPAAFVSLPGEVAFDVNAADGGVTRVAGLAWSAPKATTVILLVHGLSGVKENYWDTLPSVGYAFAARLAAAGHAAVAIDLPGYGESQTPTGASGLEDFAFVLDQIATQLRSAQYQGATAPYARVIGHGLSLGGAAVFVAQGMYGSFDVVIPAGFSLDGLRADYVRCQVQDEPACPHSPDDDFELDRAEPDVVAATLAGYEGGEHTAQAANLIAWYGACGVPKAVGACPSGGTVDQLAGRIDVPVLLLVGEADRLMDMAGADAWVSRFPLAPEVVVKSYPGVGHFVHNHDIHVDAAATISSFVAAHSE